MKITNLYTYGDVKNFGVKSLTELDYAPVISNVVDSKRNLECYLQPGVYDSAKENINHLDLVEHLGLADLSFEELAEVTLQSQIGGHQISDFYPKTRGYKEARFKAKIDYIIRKIDSYWPSHIDKYSVLYKRIFQGKSYQRIMHDFGVQVSIVKLLISDYRKLCRLYKAHLISKNNMRKLRPEHFEFINQFIFNHRSLYWTAATLQKALISKFYGACQISQSTLRSRLKVTFGMSFKQIKRQNIIPDEKQRQRRFAIGCAIQTILNSQNYEFMFIDEFLLSDRSFKFYGWSKKGMSVFISTMGDTFSMSFFVAFSVNRFYGIMGIEGTGTSQIFIHFLNNVLNKRKKLNLDKTRPLVIVLDNASIHKTKEAIKFIIDSKIPMITIPPYEPSLNPVEKLIFSIKSKLRQKKHRGQ